MMKSIKIAILMIFLVGICYSQEKDTSNNKTQSVIKQLYLRDSLIQHNQDSMMTEIRVLQNLKEQFNWTFIVWSALITAVIFAVVLFVGFINNRKIEKAVEDFKKDKKEIEDKVEKVENELNDDFKNYKQENNLALEKNVLKIEDNKKEIYDSIKTEFEKYGKSFDDHELKINHIVGYSNTLKEKLISQSNEQEILSREVYRGLAFLHAGLAEQFANVNNLYEGFRKAIDASIYSIRATYYEPKNKKENYNNEVRIYQCFSTLQIAEHYLNEIKMKDQIIKLINNKSEIIDQIKNEIQIINDSKIITITENIIKTIENKIIQSVQE